MTDTNSYKDLKLQGIKFEVGGQMNPLSNCPIIILY